MSIFDQLQKIYDISLEKEMKESYLDYAMSVIVGRALPDVRDGLKPVQRRILYAMLEAGLRHDKPFKKSARVVGEVLGKYHPHGDSAVYEALVRMAQDFSMRYPLVQGHGNFGSIDGDSPAAMRYTEVRLSKIGEELLKDIDKETVDFVPNFDESLKEPSVLPSVLPNLLLNGSTGIAVGMTTNIPPHNITEIVNAIIAYLDNEDISIVDLLSYVKGPDFPTGGIITNPSEIVKVYVNGNGKLKLRGIVDIERVSNKREALVIKQIPYQVLKTSIIEKIASLVKEGRIKEISDLRDESDRDGIRVVIELKKGVDAQRVLNKLYKYTQLETTYSVIMVALVDNVPKVLNLKQMIGYFVDHRIEVITRRTKYLLRKAEDRLEVVKGYLVAIKNIDEVVKIIKSSKNAAIAKEKLMEYFDLTQKQAQAILDMRLHRLTSLELEKLEEEKKQLEATITDYKDILASEHRKKLIIKEELQEALKIYSDDRKTLIATQDLVISKDDLEEKEEGNFILTMSHSGYLKKVRQTEYKKQKRGGKGVIVANLKEDDFPKHVEFLPANNIVLFFTNYGKVHGLRSKDIPLAKRESRGESVNYLLKLDDDEKVKDILVIKDFNQGGQLFIVTEKGKGKKVAISDLKSALRQGGIVIQKVPEGDSIAEVIKIDENNPLISVFTQKGYTITFDTDKDLRVMGRAASGVKIMNVSSDDKIISATVTRGFMLVVSENGYAKLLDKDLLKVQKRGGKGIKYFKVNEKVGNVVEVLSCNEDDEAVIMTDDGKIIRVMVNDISVQGRYASGVRVINSDGKVTSAAIVKGEDK